MPASVLRPPNSTQGLMTKRLEVQESAPITLPALFFWTKDCVNAAGYENRLLLKT